MGGWKFFSYLLVFFHGFLWFLPRVFEGGMVLEGSSKVFFQGGTGFVHGSSTVGFFW